MREQSESTPKTTTTTTYGISAKYTHIQNQLLELPPMIEGYKNEVSQLKRELREVSDELQKLLNQIPENQHTLTQLRTKIELVSTIKEEIEKRYLESEIIGAESDINPKQKGGIEIVDIAVPRKVPVSPQFKLIVILSGIVGLCLGITFALFSEFVKRSKEDSRN